MTGSAKGVSLASTPAGPRRTGNYCLQLRSLPFQVMSRKRETEVGAEKEALWGPNSTFPTVFTQIQDEPNRVLQREV